MMTLDLDRIEAAARKAGGRPWYCGSITRTGLTEVRDYVGGSRMFPIVAETYEAQFIEASNPAVVLELIRRLRDLSAAVLRLDPESVA